MEKKTNRQVCSTFLFFYYYYLDKYNNCRLDDERKKKSSYVTRTCGAIYTVPLECSRRFAVAAAPTVRKQLLARNSPIIFDMFLVPFCLGSKRFSFLSIFYTRL